VIKNKKKWSFHKIDWDKIIAEEGISIDVDDLQSMNNTEMVEILNLVGIRAHRGMPREKLKSLLLGEKLEVKNPFDKLRDRTIKFIQNNYDKIRDQMVLRCNGNCYQHSDMESLICYIASKNEIEKDLKGDPNGSDD
jgi:hypothetical protein